MRAWFKLAAPAAVCLAGVSAVSFAAPGEGRTAAVARPAVAKIAPATVASGQRITVTGRRFVRGKRRNRVVFLGRAGRRDDRSVRATVAGPKKIVLKTSRGEPSGRILVINRFGKSAPSKRSVTFDDDRDGLSNEQERKLGTNPRLKDTDGDGVPDGKDSDPLHAPSPDPGPGGPGPDVPAPSCPVVAVAGPGSGPSSSFAGLENVIGEGRALISHSTLAGGLRYCVYRKRRSQPDSDYQLVGNDTAADTTIRDGQRPSKAEDYVYRTDAVTASGVLAGSDTVGARGAGGVPNVDGWSDINQTCIGCGGASVQGGVLKASAHGSGSAGPSVGQTVVYKRRMVLEDTPNTDEWVTRAITPFTPSAPGSYVSANLTISDEHPAVARSATTVADVTHSDSGRPFINLELRAQEDGQLRVIVRDSNGSQEYTSTDAAHPGAHDLRADYGAIGNAYLVVSILANRKYTAGVSLPSGQGVDIVTGRAIPDGLTSGWLSLRSEQSNEETAQSDVRFDEVNVTGQPNDADLNERFPGINGPIQAAPGFKAEQVAGEGTAGVAGDLNSPTAIEFAPNGDMFIAERGGRIWRRPSAGGALDEVLDLRADVVSKPFADQGLLGFALDPSFATNGWAYIYYTVETDPANPDDPDLPVRTVARVQRIHFDGANFDATTRETLVGTADPAPGSGDACPPATNSDCLPADAYTHTAGGLDFGADGKLWISVPDGADPDPGSGDVLARRVQNSNSLAGKLLRVEPATGKAVSTNPGYTDDANSRTPVARTWVRGFRNPFRLAQRPGGTNAWYVTDVGWNTWEEVNVVPSAIPAPTFNYGWPCFEGPDRRAELNYTTGECTEAGLFPNHNAAHYYASSPADHAVIGGGFYTGSAWPAPWKPAAGNAAFYYSDYPTGEVYRLEMDAADAEVSQQTFAAGFTGPVEVTEGPADLTAPAGETAIYVVNIGDVRNPSATDGKVWRITQAGP